MSVYLSDPDVTLYHGDALETLRGLEAESVDCCVTSPPYWHQRIYSDDPRELGREDDPAEYVAGLVAVFREVRRVLGRGALWLNVGDKYAAGGMGGGGSRGDRRGWETIVGRSGWRSPPKGYKEKDLTLTPFRLAEALRVDGWYLRQTVVWRKPSAVEPERLDRPSTSHEYVFLLTPYEDSSVRNPGEAWWFHSVWEIRADAITDGHPAPMPVELARRCIVASARPGSVVLDPFAGSGTTGLAARQAEGSALLIELNESYCDLVARRLSQLSLLAERTPA